MVRRVALGTAVLVAGTTSGCHHAGELPSDTGITHYFDGERAPDTGIAHYFDGEGPPGDSNIDMGEAPADANRSFDGSASPDAALDADLDAAAPSTDAAPLDGDS
jgi:hypothetical protein